MLEYHYDIEKSAWIVTLDREQDIAQFLTPEEAESFCDKGNAGTYAKSQSEKES